MIKRTTLLLAATALVCSLAACDEKKTETKTETTTTSAEAGVATTTTVTTTTKTEPIKIEDSDLSTPADFEEAVEKSITKTTYKAELASLETDISKPE